jgi:glycerate kinase
MSAKNVKFVLAPDSFKESMSAQQVCEAMERGIRKVFPVADILQLPMADGGEGTVDSLTDATGGERLPITVSGPLPGQKIDTYFGLLGNAVTTTAVIEMAKASGLEYVPLEARNPLVTTTYGTGEMIKAAIDAGAKRIILGIGGSATNDGGAGMATALGAKLLDENGEAIPLG